MYMSANMYLYFSHALSSQSMRTDEAYSESPRQNYKCCSQDYSTILSSDEYILQCVYSAVVSFSAIYFVFWQTLLILLGIKSMQVIILDLFQRKKGNALGCM